MIPWFTTSHFVYFVLFMDCLVSFQMTGATPYFAAAFVGGLFIVVGMVGSMIFILHVT